jgi:hypothetical protein
MDGAYILNFISEIAYILIVFGIFLAFAIIAGRQALMNVIVGLYFALLISLEFPNYDTLFSNFGSSEAIAGAKLGFFAFLTAITTALCYRIMPSAFSENKFESFGKKLLLAGGATILVMIFSFHVLPVTEFLVAGTPIQSLFGPEVYFFWWLLVPLVILYIV